MILTKTETMKKSGILFLFLLATTFMFAQTVDCSLEILNVDFPTSIQPRQKVQVTATVRNNDSVISDTTTIGVYSTTYGSKFPGPIPYPVGVAVPFLPLQPNEERTMTFEVQMPEIFSEYIEMINQKSRQWSVFVGKRKNIADRDCEYPIEFSISFLPANLELLLLTENSCIAENTTLEYQITNLGSETVGPIFISGGYCPLLGPSQQFSSSCTIKIDKIPPNKTITFSKNHNYFSERNPFYGTNNFGVYINSSFSNINNSNENNGAGLSLNTAPICPSFKTENALCYAVRSFSVLDKIYVSGLLTDYAKVAIIGANTNWQEQTICEGDCDGNTIIADLKAGVYTVKVQLNGADGSDCYLERQITVEGITSPPISQTANCDDLVFATSANQIEVQNLNTTFSQIQIIGRNTDWQVRTICSGDCAENQVIPNLEAGEYAVKVQLNASDGSDCYREEKIIVDNNDGNNTDDNNTEGVDCANLNFSGNNEQISVTGLTAANEKIEIIGHNTDWQIVLICDGDCAENQAIPNLKTGEYTVKVNQFGSDGSYCYREEKVMVIGENDGENTEDNQNGNADCDALQFTTPLTEQIRVLGLNAAYNKVEIVGWPTNWEVQTICDGDCQSEQVIFPLSGEYTVKVSQSGADGQFCYREEKLKVFQSGRNRATDNLTKEITLFPNPVQSIFYLDLTQLADKTGQIQIFNSYGQLVQEFPKMTFSGEIETINVSDFENGFYYLTIKTENTKLVTKRFVVESYK